MPGEDNVFLLSTLFWPVLGPIKPTIYWVSWALSLKVKKPGPEADHSPPTSVEIK
jgi:hypothetical protein